MTIITLGAVFQVVGTGLTPILRNLGGAIYATVFMIIGFVTNIIGDYLLVWHLDMGVYGAAVATIVGQGATMAGTIGYLVKRKKLFFFLPAAKIGTIFKNIVRVGIAPFGLALTPNFSLILINRFSVSYGGNEAIACYACVSYVMTIVYLLLQGVGDGSQPLMSQFYGSGNDTALKSTRRYAYGVSIALGAVSIALIYAFRSSVGVLFGASEQVLSEVAAVLPIFLIPVPCIAVSRITTSAFYATEKSAYSYLLTYAEPLVMLLLLFVLPRFCGGQIMVWWSAAIAQMLVAVLAMIVKAAVNTADVPHKPHLDGMSK